MGIAITRRCNVNKLPVRFCIFTGPLNRRRTSFTVKTLVCSEDRSLSRVSIPRGNSIRLNALERPNHDRASTSARCFRSSLERNSKIRTRRVLRGPEQFSAGRNKRSPPRSRPDFLRVTVYRAFVFTATRALGLVIRSRRTRKSPGLTTFRPLFR